MSRRLVAIVAAGIAFGSTMGFAADGLTKEERADMRSRAERLTAERAQLPAQTDTAVGKTHKAAKPPTTESVATKLGTTKSGATKRVATKAVTTKSGATKPGKATTPAVKKGEPKV